MTIIRSGKDVTEEIVNRAEALRTGPHGCNQRDLLFGIITKALLSFDDIPLPWLDDCIYETKQSLQKLRAAIPKN